MKTFFIKYIGIVFSSVFAASAVAHDVWFVPHGDSYRLVYGHPGELEPYDPAKARSITGIGGDGDRVEIATQITDQQIIAEIPANVSLVVTEFDNGFWTENQNGEFANVSKREVSNYRSSSHSKKFNKALFNWSAAAGRPLGADFELVPLENPFSLKPGESLNVQLLYKSKPLPGAEVEILGSMELYETDEDGKVSLPISDDRFQYILARHKEELVNHPDADVLALETNLTFFR